MFNDNNERKRKVFVSHFHINFDVMYNITNFFFFRISKKKSIFLKNIINKIEKWGSLVKIVVVQK